MYCKRYFIDLASPDYGSLLSDYGNLNFTLQYKLSFVKILRSSISSDKKSLQIAVTFQHSFIDKLNFAKKFNFRKKICWPKINQARARSYTPRCLTKCNFRSIITQKTNYAPYARVKFALFLTWFATFWPRGKWLQRHSYWIF